MALIKNLIHRSLLPLILITLISSQVNAGVPKANYLLQRMVQTYNSVDFEGRLTLMLQAPGGNQVFEIMIIRKAPDKRRIEVLSPPELAGTGVVINGSEFVPLRPGKGRRLPPQFQQPDQVEDIQIYNVQLLSKNYKIRVLDGGKVAGRNTYLLEIDPKNPDRPSSKIWVDTEKNVVLKVEKYDAQKVLQRVTAYSNINFNPEIDEKIFRIPHRFPDMGRFRPPDREEIWNHNQGNPDLNVIRDKVKFGVILPKLMPNGFMLQSINILKIGKEWNVHLKYTDGLTILSIFQSPFDETKFERPRNEPPGPPGDQPPGPPRDQPPRPPISRGKMENVNINGVECEILSRKPALILRWQNVGVYFTLIGELQKKEMVKIAGSFIKKESHVR